MSLFQGLFASQSGSGGGLFSENSKYAAPSPTNTAVTKAAAVQRGAAAQPPAVLATQAGSSDKKRRKSSEGAPAGSVRTEEGEKPQKRQRKWERQHDAAPTHEQAARAAAAAAASGAYSPAGNERLRRVQAGIPAKAGKAGQGTLGAEAVAKRQPSADKKARTTTTKTVPAAAEEDVRLPRTVFVGNLPATVKRKSLARLFAACGAVESVRLRSLPLKQEPESKIPRRGAIASGAIDTDHSAHAYIVFKEPAAIEAALAFNMREWEGHHLRVDRAVPKAGKGEGQVLFDPSRSLFVGNLPLDIEDEDVIQHFGPDNVEAVRVVRDGKTGAGKGIAFVLFKDQEASKAATRQRGSKLKGRTLRITRVQRQQDGKAAWQQGRSDKGAGGSSKAGGAKPVGGKRKAGGKRLAVAARKLSQKQQNKQAHSKRQP